MKKFEPIKIFIKFESWVILNDLKDLILSDKHLKDTADLLIRAAKQKHHIIIKENEVEQWYLSWNWEKEWFDINLIE